MFDPPWDKSLIDRLKAVVRRHVHPGAAVDASDLVSSAIVAAYRRREQFRGTTDAEFHAWLRSIVERKYISRHRLQQTLKRGAGKTISLDVEQGIEPASREQTPDLDASDHEISVLLMTLFQQLGEEHAELLYLSNYCGLSNAELATKCGLTKNQVSNRLRTAKRRLKKTMRKLGLDAANL